MAINLAACILDVDLRENPPTSGATLPGTTIEAMEYPSEPALSEAVLWRWRRLFDDGPTDNLESIVIGDPT
jgi:hypothetical protein